MTDKSDRGDGMTYREPDDGPPGALPGWVGELAEYLDCEDYEDGEPVGLPTEETE